MNGEFAHMNYNLVLGRRRNKINIYFFFLTRSRDFSAFSVGDTNGCEAVERVLTRSDRTFGKEKKIRIIIMARDNDAPIQNLPFFLFLS